MSITIITDCYCENARGRQLARISSLFNQPTNFIGVLSDLAAAGNLIDILDAYRDNPGVVLVNIAPRQNRHKKFFNGTPFGYFWYKNILVVTTLEGLTLSLIKDLELADIVYSLDIARVVDELITKGDIDKNLKNRIVNTQFRSFEFVPFVAKYLYENKYIIAEKIPIATFPSPPQSIWHIDNFGNCKTTISVNEDLTEDELQKTISLKLLGYPEFYTHLKDVQDDCCGVIIGSSGINNKRFIEIVYQGKSAAEVLGVKIGDNI